MSPRSKTMSGGRSNTISPEALVTAIALHGLAESSQVGSYLLGGQLQIAECMTDNGRGSFKLGLDDLGCAGPSKYLVMGTTVSACQDGDLGVRAEDVGNR